MWAAFQRALLDQLRRAALGERDLDEIEVARRDRPGKHLARLGEHVGDVVARGDVDEGEQVREALGTDTIHTVPAKHFLQEDQAPAVAERIAGIAAGA